MNRALGPSRLALVVVFAILAAGCRKPLPHCEAGYELYSWKVEALWHYTVITGTSRAKTPEELSSPGGALKEGWTKVTTRGRETLNKIFMRMPPGERLVWMRAEASGFVLPPKDEADAVAAEAAKYGMRLEIAR